LSKYGNLEAQQYVDWLADLAPRLKELLTPTGSIAIEMGNAWVAGVPVMSTLAIEALLEFKRRAGLHLCQEFIAYNPARLPSPVQWVNVERRRVKDAFTRIWWLAATPRPNASNRRILKEYGDDMKKLLKRGTYNSGRPF
jgi:site-specific DNA-methyltransferase (cytosine-N4-specific)